MEKTYTNIERNGDILVGEAFTPMLLGKKAHLSATACVLKDATGEVVAAIECIRTIPIRKNRRKIFARLRKDTGAFLRMLRKAFSGRR